MFYKTGKLRFECTGCGDCCRGNPAQYYIYASSRELGKIQRFLDISEAWFRRRYLVRLDTSSFGIRMMPAGHCSFLDGSGKCRIYSVRPVQCRTYPWWPEIVETRAGWRNEAKRCEGINQGVVVPLKKITAELKKSTED
ncbi:MAG: YkgJ family cysteine cluster protein [Gammaproteobacteria bacterium]|nr:YkgJ family cysteine cluster protein [Gammaproteobacteria bacterium]MDH5592828.1 YkgJ family cysteine cluster protein [Gammaproteobacteria bacterium]MDH5613955.1 YkgJ family cysteine cluster protein [Gammaproteobacteria bacterium]